MSESELLLLLRIIATKAELEPLLRRGYRYAQISRLIQKALDEGFIKQDQEGLKLSSRGIDKLKLTQSRGSLFPDGGWITAAEDFRREQKSPDEVYLPSIGKSVFNIRETD